MFGSYQAGVWAELSQAWKPDIIVGASIGALNGWMIAGGCGTEDLMEHWRSLRRLERHRFRVPLPPWRGLIVADHLEEMVEEICGSFRPRQPLGIVTTQWAGLRLRLHRDEEITLRHLLASCAIPLVLPQQRLEGRWHSDGGVLSASPVSAAIKMGATEVVTINVLPKMPWFVRMPMRVASVASGHRVRTPRQVNIVRIRPEPVLGSWKESCYWDGERTEQYIARGREDGRRAVEELTQDCRQIPARAGR